MHNLTGNLGNANQNHTPLDSMHMPGQAVDRN